MAEALLIGAEIDSAFFLLNRKLREQTLDFARRKFSRVITKYNPWLCFAPIMTTLDKRLAHAIPKTRGELIEDPDALGALADLFRGDGQAALEGLPGRSDQWLPSSNGISNNLSEAIEIIRSVDDVVGVLFEEVVDCIVPLGGGRNRGYSTHLARGAIFRSLPIENDASDVAIDIVHELGHQVLIVWQSVDPILESDPLAPVFSQIRRVDRPAIQTFHATVALAYMRTMEMRHPTNGHMQSAAARRGKSYDENLSYSLALSIHSVRKHCRLTDVGERMLREMENVV